MKKTLTILVLFSMTMKAQLTLENIYTSPGRFILTEIAPNEFKYFSFDDPANQFKLYNLNHSLFMTVNVPLTYNFGVSTYFVSYVSRSLFDCDSTNIEYAVMYLGTGGPSFPAPYFAVYRTNGTLFQKIDSVRYSNYSAASSYGTYAINGPIINTPAGAKIILVKPSGSVAIYSLCGLLPTNITKNENNLDELYNPFPNPSNIQITLPYSIPIGESGKLTVFNSAGQTVKEFDVDNNFNSIILAKSELPPGTYFYNVKTRHKCSETQKFILTD